MNIIIATIHDWNIRNYYKWKEPNGYKKYLIKNKTDLKLWSIKKINPQYIFFPHWSWKIPEEIWKTYECVVFHMTDLPFGRGGTPLQNLIARGIYKTKISAIRVTNQLDSGPIYLKKNFSIKDGSAQEIYDRASNIIFQMIEEIIKKKVDPLPQQGKVTIFKRLTPMQSEIPLNLQPRQVYDFIRMLDAESYPPAYLKFGDYRLEFRNAKLDNKQVFADVLIKKEKK